MLDAIIIGAGHNGLVCACYLAAAGLKVRVLERRGVVGGAAVTEEFHPGFRNSVASYAVSLLEPKIIKELRLKEHGLEIIERELSSFMPLSDNQFLELHSDLDKTQAEIARFSRRDAERLPDFYEMLDGVADVLKKLMLEAPPNMGGGIHEVFQSIKVAKVLKKLSLPERRNLLDMFGKSAGDLLNGWFECEPLKGNLGFDAVTGNFASPFSPGSAYMFLHHAIGGVNGKKRVWGHARGGMGSITQAMAKEAMARGVEIQVDAPVKRVNVKNRVAVGVTLQDGVEILAKKVIANVNPKLLYLELMNKSDLDADFLQRIQNYKCESGTFRMNVALSELPRFSCKKNDSNAHLQSGIVFAPSLEHLEKAYFDARTEGWSQKPNIEMLIPSTVDDSLAPPGKHVASLFCQHFSPQLPHGQSWDDVKERVADHIIDYINDYAPNFKASVLGRMVLSPLDLERKLGLIGGDIFHGALTIDQLFSARPILAHGNYKGPVKELYMCGSGTHPGGGVSGAPGHNAAKEILRRL